jgi:preprotein translocase subunit SecF
LAYLRLIPDDTKFGFMRFRRISFPFSALLSILAIVLFFGVGLNFGIDFRGGTLIEVQSKSGQADLGDMRERLGGLGIGDVQLQEFGGPANVLIRIERQPGGDAEQQAVVAKVRGALGETVDFRRVEVVGPRVSGELVRAGIIGVLVSIIAIFVYLWFRFEWQFALGAAMATMHDVVLTIGFYALLQIDFDLSSIAAILTIVGYSLNDTVVVYDRVREMLRKYKKLSIEDLLDIAMNSTLGRTTVTSVTTLLALLGLLFFGPEVIQSFVKAMIFGVVIGTYSSIFIAAPLLIYLGLKVGSLDAEGTTAKAKP